MSRLQPISTPTSTPFPYTTLFRSFDAWKAESPTNVAAYARAEAAWRLFDDPPGDAVMDAMRASALAIRLPARRGLWTGMGVGLAASLLLAVAIGRSEEHTSELQSLIRISNAVLCLKKKRIPK